MVRSRRSAFFWTLLLATTALGWAAAPHAALSYRAPDLELLANEVTRAEREVQRAVLGLTGSLEVEPILEYGVDEDELYSDLDLEASVELAYLYDKPYTLGRIIDLLGAKDAYQDAERAGIWEALLAQIDLIQTQFQLGLLRQDLADLERAHREVQALNALGEASDTELASARLDVTAAQLALEAAEYELSDARTEANRFGVANSTFQLLRFALPQVQGEQTLAYRRAQLAVEQNELLALQNSAYEILEEIELGASYEVPNAVLSGGLSLEGGLPGAHVGADLDYGDTEPGEWSISLGATLRLDDRTVDNFEEANLELEATRDELRDTLADFKLDQRDLSREVALSQREIELLQAELALDEQRIKELTNLRATLPGQLETLRERLAQAEARQTTLTLELEESADEAGENFEEALSRIESELTELETSIRDSEGELTAVERDLEIAAAERETDKDELYDAWRVYFTAVYGYLALTGQPWAVQE